jgi:energy-coupling factor transport system permease protein
MNVGAGQKLGRYVALRSPVHSLDPLVKVTSFGLILAGALVASTWPALGIVAAYVAFVCLASRVKPVLYLESLKYFAWMFALSFAVNAVFPREGAGPAFGARAIEIGAVFAVRLALVVIAATAFTMITSPSEIGDAVMVLSRVRGRVGRRAAEAASLVAMSLRFVPVMFEEAERIRAAQVLRGGRGKGIAGRARSVVEVIVPLIESSLRRASNLAFALDARCYGTCAPVARGMHLGKREAAFLASTVGLLFVAVRLR